MIPGGTATLKIEIDGNEHWLARHLESQAAEDDPIDLYIECAVESYDPGVINGPPERCYPPEGGEVEIIEAWAEINGRRVEVNLEEFKAADRPAYNKWLAEVEEAATLDVHEQAKWDW